MASSEETKINPDLLKNLGRRQEEMPQSGPTNLPAGPGSSGTVDPHRPPKQS